MIGPALSLGASSKGTKSILCYQMNDYNNDHGQWRLIKRFHHKFFDYFAAGRSPAAENDVVRDRRFHKFVPKVNSDPMLDKELIS